MRKEEFNLRRKNDPEFKEQTDFLARVFIEECEKKLAEQFENNKGIYFSPECQFFKENGK